MVSSRFLVFASPFYPGPDKWAKAYAAIDPSDPWWSRESVTLQTKYAHPASLTSALFPTIMEDGRGLEDLPGKPSTIPEKLPSVFFSGCMWLGFLRLPVLCLVAKGTNRKTAMFFWAGSSKSTAVTI